MTLLDRWVDAAVAGEGVADLLGISIQTATRWAELTGRTCGYIANRDE